MFISLK